MAPRPLLTVLVALAMLLSPYAAEANTITYCSNNQTLNTTTDLYTDGARTVLTENTSCQFGCVGGAAQARCNNDPALIPIEIYLFLGGVGIVLIILSFMKNEKNRYISVFPWLAMIIFVVLALTSPNILLDGKHFESSTLVWFWLGMSVLSFLIAVYSLIENSQRQLEEKDMPIPHLKS